MRKGAFVATGAFCCSFLLCYFWFFSNGPSSSSATPSTVFGQPTSSSAKLLPAARPHSTFPASGGTGEAAATTTPSMELISVWRETLETAKKPEVVAHATLYGARILVPAERASWFASAHRVVVQQIALARQNTLRGGAKAASRSRLAKESRCLIPHICAARQSNYAEGGWERENSGVAFPGGTASCVLRNVYDSSVCFANDERVACEAEHQRLTTFSDAAVLVEDFVAVLVLVVDMSPTESHASPAPFRGDGTGRDRKRGKVSKDDGGDGDAEDDGQQQTSVEGRLLWAQLAFGSSLALPGCLTDITTVAALHATQSVHQALRQQLVARALGTMSPDRLSQEVSQKKQLQQSGGKISLPGQVSVATPVATMAGLANARLPDPLSTAPHTHVFFAVPDNSLSHSAYVAHLAASLGQYVAFGLYERGIPWIIPAASATSSTAAAAKSSRAFKRQTRAHVWLRWVREVSALLRFPTVEIPVDTAVVLQNVVFPTYHLRHDATTWQHIGLRAVCHRALRGRSVAARDAVTFLTFTLPSPSTLDETRRFAVRSSIKSFQSEDSFVKLVEGKLNIPIAHTIITNPEALSSMSLVEKLDLVTRASQIITAVGPLLSEVLQLLRGREDYFAKPVMVVALVHDAFRSTIHSFGNQTNVRPTSKFRLDVRRRISRDVHSDTYNGGPKFCLRYVYLGTNSSLDLLTPADFSRECASKAGFIDLTRYGHHRSTKQPKASRDGQNSIFRLRV